MKTVFTPFAIVVALAALMARADPSPSPATAPATKPATEQPPDLRLSLAPAPLPAPALKYSLIPPAHDQTTGDAALLYLKAFARLKTSEDDYQLHSLLESPREKFPIDAAEQLVSKYRTNLDDIEIAARRDRCHWELPFRELGLATMLPHLNPARSAALLLSLQARVQIARGRFDDALHTLQSISGLIEHLKSDAVLVQGLVGVGIANLLLDRVEDFIQAPGAPNLYWALAWMPRPVSDMRAMGRTERSWLDYELPELKRGPAQLAPGALGSLIARIKHIIELGHNTPEGVRDKILYIAMVGATDPVARKWLAANGYSDEQIKQMSGEQAVGAYFIESYRRLSDDLIKPTNLPYWLAREGYARAEKKLQRARTEPLANPLLQLLPAMSHVHRQIALAGRRIVMLQAVEALRGYAAAHDGKLPASLDDLAQTPVPVDPMTGRGFQYEAQGGSAVLRSLEPMEPWQKSSGVYRIRLITH